MATVGELLIALAVICVLAFAMRWAFRPTRPRTGPLIDAADSTQLGLLDVVAPHVSRAQALAIRNRLGDAGIRTSLSRRHDGNVDVVVFHDDAPRARALLG